MARLRYLQNKRSGAHGTISKSTEKIYFYDEGLYIGATADGTLALISDTTLNIEGTTALNLTGTTITLTGAITVNGDITFSGDDNILVTLTDPTSTVSAIYGIVNAAGTTGWSADEICPIRGALNIDVRSPGDYATGAGGWFELDYASTLTADGVGLTAGVYVNVDSANALKIPTAVLYLEQQTTGNGTVTTMPMVVLSSKGTENDKSRIAFSFGFPAAGTTVGTGTSEYMYYGNTIRCRINGTMMYLPFSTAEATFTTAYPIVSSQTAAAAIQLGTSGKIQFRAVANYISSSGSNTLDIVSPTINITASTIVQLGGQVWIGTDASPVTLVNDAHEFAVHSAITGHATGWFNAIEFDTELGTGCAISGDAQLVGVQAYVRLATGAIWSSSGGACGLSSIYIGVGTNTVSDGIHSGLGAMVRTAAGYTLTQTAELCALVVGNQVNASANIATGKFSGILIQTSGAYEEYDQAIKIAATCDTGILITGASNYALDATTGCFRIGTFGTGIPTSDTYKHTMEIYTEPTAAFTATGLVSGIRCRYEISTAQTAQVTIAAIDARLRIKASMADGVHSGIQGIIEGSETCTLSGTSTTQRNAGTFTVELGTGFSFTGDGWLCGVAIDSATNGSLSMSGVQYVGLRINVGTNKEPWEEGINISGCTTGIAIGTSTTSNIAISGTNATGIAMTGTYSTAGISITHTDTAGSKPEILITSTFTAQGAVAHKAIESNVTYTPATSGTGVPIAIAGKVTLAANQTHSGLYMWGIQGGIKFLGGSVVASSQIAAGRFVLEEADAVTYTSGHIACIYCDNLITSPMADESSGLIELLKLSNHGGQMDNAIHVRGYNVTNLFWLADADVSVGGFSDLSATAGNMTHTVKCEIDGTDAYLHFYDE